MMVMPLGPDFAAALDIPMSHLGYIGGSYTAAAAVAGVAGSWFLDRFDRRSALAVTMLGLVIGTAAGGLATGLVSLMAARVLAGAFGGPATSLSLSIIADVVPQERRGKALGMVMGAFAAASVIGVPVGLEMARLGGWRLPFFAVAGLGLLVAAGAIGLMPPMKGHFEHHAAQKDAGHFDFLSRPIAWWSLAGTGGLMLATFSVVPNLSAYLQKNLGYPREKLGLLFFVGGLVSFAGMRAMGRFVDRFGATSGAWIGTVCFSLVLVSMAYPPSWIPVMGIFVGLMVSNSFRGVANQTLVSKVPLPAERARFMSAQSAVQHTAAALGAVGSSWILTTSPDGKLEHMPALLGAAILIGMMFPVTIYQVESRLKSPV